MAHMGIRGARVTYTSESQTVLSKASPIESSIVLPRIVCLPTCKRFGLEWGCIGIHWVCIYIEKYKLIGLYRNM